LTLVTSLAIERGAQRMSAFCYQLLNPLVGANTVSVTYSANQIADVVVANSYRGVRALSDAPYTALWSVTSYAGIRPVTDDEISSSSPERWYLDNNNRVYFALVNGETYTASADHGLLVFQAPHNGERKIQEITFSFDYDLPTDWEVRILAYNEGFTSGVAEYTFTSAGSPSTGSTTVTFSAAKDFVVFQCRNNTGGNVTFTGNTATKYAKLTSLRIKSTTSSNVYADEIVTDLVSHISGINSGQLADSTVLVDNPTVDLQDEVYADQSPASILTYLAGLGDNQTPPREWVAGVWGGQRLHFQPKGWASRQWHTDLVAIELESTLDTLANEAYATYKDANNRVLRTDVETDALSVARFGVTRRGVTAASTTSQTQAETTRDTFLDANATPNVRSRLVTQGLFDAQGARYPHWMVRAGDVLSIRNLPPTVGASIDRIRTFRLSKTVYDVDTDSLTITPDLDVPDLAVLLGNAL